MAGRICCSTLEELRRLDLTFACPAPNSARPAHLGTWMIWMVHRVKLNDPELRRLDFSSYGMPSGEAEPRIAPKLVTALARNSHLRELCLTDCNLRSREAKCLAESLRKNVTLRVLNIGCNFLEPEDLKAIFVSLAFNRTLQELRCCSQFAAEVGKDELKVLAEVLKQNETLQKLGLDLLDKHWRNEINTALIKNAEAARKRRRDALRSA